MSEAQENVATLSQPIKFAQEPDKEGIPQKRKFTGLAYSGKPVDYYGERLVVDLQDYNMNVPLGVLDSHDGASRVGFVDKGTLTEKGLEVSGSMLSNANAKRISDDALDGFPFQMSIQVTAGHVDRLPEGEVAMVNGAEVNGPIKVMRNVTIGEISFASVGADKNTSASVFSKRDGEKPHAIEPEGNTQMSDTPKTTDATDILREQLNELRAEMAQHNKASQDQIAVLTAQAQKEAERAEAAESLLAQQNKVAREIEVRALFDEAGLEFEASSAAPFLEMNAVSFAAAASGMRKVAHLAAKRSGESSLFSDYTPARAKRPAQHDDDENPVALMAKMANAHRPKVLDDQDI